MKVKLTELNHDGVFQQSAYALALGQAALNGQLVQDIDTGALVLHPPERTMTITIVNEGVSA